ncbi:MAG: Mur ligase family protein, partial [Gemmatimonadales bacterium]
ASLLLDRPGAILEIRVEDARQDAAVSAWEAAARRMLDAVGWTAESLAVRRYRGGLSLAFTAPVDALYAATEVNEWAWESAAATLSGGVPPDFDAASTRLRLAIAGEQNPALLALREEARSRGLTFLSDDDWVSVGSGSGSRVWPARSAPAVASVDWSDLHDIPVALVTGSNGKTTVVRLLGAMVSASGRVPGLTTTDGITIGGSSIAEGDWSGPSGARLVLRRSEVETAVLETARGGLLRRGLPVERAAVAVVTNIADDHLGEFGVHDLRELAETKLLVTRTVGSNGRVVLNAEDPVLVEAATTVAAPVTWFSLDPELPLIRAHLAREGCAALLTAEGLSLCDGQKRTLVAEVSEVPIAFGGAARHNLANLLAAVGAADGLDLTLQSKRQALREFGRSPTDNLGRANLLEIGGVRIVVDYAHNPHGMAALVEMTADFGSTRRLVLLGQAGDRSDEAIRELARASLALHPDRIVLKDMKDYLRGRPPGEIPALFASELRRLGVSAEAISCPGSELAAVREALAWARPGDLLVLTVHAERRGVMRLLQELREASWKAGEPLPAPSLSARADD